MGVAITLADIAKRGLLFGGSGSGGGSGGGGIRMATGTVTVTEDRDITHPNYFAVDHGLGTEPKMIVFQDAAQYPVHGSSGSFVSMNLFKFDNNTYTKKVIYYSKNGTGVITRSTAGFPTENVFYVGNIGSTTELKLSSNTTYNWYAFDWEE